MFVVASDWETARAQAKSLPLVIEKQMHIDGIQKIELVDGYAIQLAPKSGDNLISSYHFRELGSKKP